MAQVFHIRFRGISRGIRSPSSPWCLSILAGMSWAVGIPGTFGGAIRGNAGAMGKEIVNVLRWVDVWRDGGVVRLKPEECAFSYRDSVFKHNKDIILRGCIYLEPGDQKEIMENMQANLKQRKHTPFPSRMDFKNIKMHKWTGDQAALPELLYNEARCRLAGLRNRSGFGVFP